MICDGVELEINGQEIAVGKLNVPLDDQLISDLVYETINHLQAHQGEWVAFVRVTLTPAGQEIDTEFAFVDNQIITPELIKHISVTMKNFLTHELVKEILSGNQTN